MSLQIRKDNTILIRFDDPGLQQSYLTDHTFTVMFQLNP